MKYKEKNLKGFGRGLIFTIIFCLIFAGFSNLFTPKADANTEGMSAMVTKAYLAEERDTIDVLFLGNSNMYRAFNPKFNQICAGQRLQKIHAKLKESIRRTESYSRPKSL